VLALGVSVLVHAGALAFLVERITRPGLEAGADAISVEIILEEPSEIASQAASPQIQSSSSEADEPEVAENRASETSAEGPSRPQTEETSQPQAPDDSVSAQPVEEPDEAAEIPDSGPPTEEPDALAEDLHPAEPTRAGPEPLQADVPSKEPAQETKKEDDVASVALPQENVPLPTPRPEPPETKRPSSLQKPARRQAGLETPRRQSEAPGRAKPSRQAGAVARSEGKKAERSQQSSSQRKGGSAAGDTRAYARRLIGHVERHKRYPREAARQGIAGTARLAVTIDRQGRLAGARLARSSGHALLDEEALATARRAAPYPRPPDGLGGGSITFTVDLRFSG